MDSSFSAKKKIKANVLSFKKSSVIMWAMVGKNVKNQYRRSVLGILWTVLNPLLTMLVMAFVFSSIFGRQGIDMDYPVYVLSGNIVFGLLRMSTTQALPSIVENYDLLTKTRVPYFVFPSAHVCCALVNFGFSLIALIIVMIIRGVAFKVTLLMIVVWLPSIFLFCLGLSLVLCSIYVRFRDIKHLYTVFLTLWMYLTPIFYSASILSAEVKSVLKINPMFHFLQYFRDLITGTVPSITTHGLIYGMGILVFILGFLFFRTQRKTFVLHI